MQLRRWQSECADVATDALERNIRGVIQAVTGGGKSILLAEIIRRWLLAHPADTVVVTTPTVKLVEQLGATIASVVGADKTGLYYTKKKQWDRQVVVACNPSVPALMAAFQKRGSVVNVWIADEVHRTETDSFADEEADDATLSLLNPERRLGLTATPFRTHGTQRLAYFDTILFRYTPADGLRDKVIVPWRIVGCEGWSPDDSTEDAFELDEACIRLIRDNATGPTAVDADNIKDAEAFAALLTSRGIPAEPYHSRTKDGEAVLGRLQRGELRAVVHVAMLCEGVDMPWLTCLCMRREVGSRVRFIQQVGRPIRAFPGKTEALLLDPHGLFDRFRLTYEAALGFDPPPPPPSPEEILEAETTRIREAPTPEAKYAAQTAALGRYVRELYQALSIEGIEMPRRKVAAGPWRKEPTSDGQVAGLVRMAPIAHRLPAEHADTVRRIVHVPDLVTKGISGDLRDTLAVLSKRDTPFVPAIPIAIPPSEAFVPPVIRTLHVALVLSKTHTAGVILRGRELVWSNVRERRVEPSADGPADSFMDLSERLFTYAVRNMKATDAEVVGSHQGAVIQAIRKFPRTPFRVVGERENPAVARCWKMIGGERRGAGERRGPGERRGH